MSIWDRWNRTPANADIKAILPRYCGRCGKPLERACQSVGFSVADGRPQFEYWLTCPDAEKKDTPYTPTYGISGVRARYVTCDLSGWAEEESYGLVYRSTFVSCEPWPTPPTVADDKPC